MPEPSFEALARAVDAAHRAGLVTIVRRLRADDAGRALLFELVDDPLIRMLFSLHGIIRTDAPAGVGAAGEHVSHEAAAREDANGCWPRQRARGTRAGRSHDHPAVGDPPPRRPGHLAGRRQVKSVTFVNAAGGWRPRTWLGAPAPGGLALPSAQPTASWLYAPRGVYLGPRSGQAGPPGPDVLVVADTGNHRVMIWNEVPEWDEQPCDVVLGQPDAFSEGPAAGRGDTKTGLNLPTGVLMHDGRLIVADAWHHRVLIYDRLPEAPGALPDLILGQPDGFSRDENRGGPAGPASFRWPHSIAGAGTSGADTELYIADAGNHRVLGWTARPDTDTPADQVIGQPDFGTATGLPYGPQTADMLRFPYAIDTDGSTLTIADTANNRILLWDRPDPRAAAVLGQPGFGPNGENHWTGVTRDSLCWPYGLSLSAGRLAIADSGNNRVVIWERE